jgi:ABC-2 type transport system permease protein
LLQQTEFSIVRAARVYAEFVRVGFINTLAYRLRYYTGIFTYFVYVSVYYFIWKAIYANSPPIEGFNFSAMLTYVGVGWIIRSFYFNNIDQELSQQVAEGKLVMDLIKPVNIQMMYFSQALGESIFRLALLTAPTAPAHCVSHAAPGELDPLRSLPGERVSYLLHCSRH